MAGQTGKAMSWQAFQSSTNICLVKVQPHQLSIRSVKFLDVVAITLKDTQVDCTQHQQ